MNIFNSHQIKEFAKLAICSLALAFTSPALTAPILKSSIKVSSAIVTVGDMFDNAGLNAELSLFRAPAPGTTGSVSINSIRIATAKAGIKNFNADGISFVNVERNGFLVDENHLTQLIISNLKTRGILSGGVFANPKFNLKFTPFYTILAEKPIQIIELKYTPTSDNFMAYFQVAGEAKKLELRGRLNLMVELPHLTNSLMAGAIIGASDIEMRAVSFNFAKTAGFATKEQFIGMQLQRPTRKGMMLRPTDIVEPEVIKRSAMVTIYYKNGPLTLTTNGQALNSAAKGEMVSVLNTKSKQIIRGIATQSGAVEIIIKDAKNI